MDTLERFNAALAYIEMNLDNDIDNKELSKIALCSFYQFQTLFAAMSGITLAEYIRSRRLDRAAFDLQNSNEKISEIALKYGYDSPTAFNRAFQKMHGMPPSKVRLIKELRIKAFPPIQFQLCIRGATILNYRIVKQKSFRMIGYRLSTSTENYKHFDTVPQFWDKTFANGNFQKLMKINLDESYSADIIKGVLGICSLSEQDESILNYYIATASNRSLPKGMVEFFINDCTYAVFDCKGKIPFSIQEMSKRIYNEWLPNSGYEWTNAPDIERYLDGDPKSDDYICELWLPVKIKNSEDK